MKKRIIDKKANEWLPQDLQNAINTFVEQFNIMEEYDLDHIPPEYLVKLFKIMSKYPQYNNVLLDLISIMKDKVE
jgi:hypothetical protein